MESLTRQEPVMSIDEAIGVYSEMLDEDRASLMFLPLCLMFRRKGMFEEAIRICREGLERHPDYNSAKAALALLLYESGQEDKAREGFEGLLGVLPDHLLARSVLGAMCRREGDLGGALAHFKVIADWYLQHPGIADLIDGIQRELAAAGSEGEPVGIQEAETGELIHETPGSEERVEEGLSDRPAAHEEVPSEPEGVLQRGAGAEDAEIQWELSELNIGRLTEKALADFYVPTEREVGDERQVEEGADEEGVAAETSQEIKDQGDGGMSPRFDAIEEVEEELPEILPTDRSLGRRGFLRPSGFLGFELAEKEGDQEGADDKGAAEVESLAPRMGEAADIARGGILSSETLADLYFRQGHLEQAARIYRDILERFPYREDVRDKLHRIQEMIQGEAEGGSQLDEEVLRGSEEEDGGGGKNRQMIAALEGWLRKLEEMKRAN